MEGAVDANKFGHRRDFRATGTAQFFCEANVVSPPEILDFVIVCLMPWYVIRAVRDRDVSVLALVDAGSGVHCENLSWDLEASILEAELVVLDELLHGPGDALQ